MPKTIEWASGLSVRKTYRTNAKLRRRVFWHGFSSPGQNVARSDNVGPHTNFKIFAIILRGRSFFLLRIAANMRLPTSSRLEKCNHRFSPYSLAVCSLAASNLQPPICNPPALQPSSLATFWCPSNLQLGAGWGLHITRPWRLFSFS